MSLDQKVRVWDAMLARIGDAMASAEAEARQSSALEDHLGRLLAGLTAQGAGRGQTGGPASPDQADGGPVAPHAE